ncbi:DUF4974 domain-containing protein [Sphingobacterium sp. SGG-5]|uniref:FecR family protein n=1 Tax=Sphingobacterium sp. SGG-5 TaxID=2710881 RepID=UPI0013EA0044|nr:FecR domain-containing protein [Sphingobacterium sp. SGG-5]NGM62660.1 DUF4974 domain-containing protein [Sphingobacterium sp. SGG-5]
MQEVNLLEFEELVRKWLADELSGRELIVFYRYLKEEAYRGKLEDILAKVYADLPADESVSRDWDRMYAAIARESHPPKRLGWRRYMPYVAAAVLLITCGLLFYISNYTADTVMPEQIVHAPTSSTIRIQDSKGGQVEWQETSVKKAYQDLLMTDSVLEVLPTAEEVIYYTVDNPKGSKPIVIRLSDASLLTLNAGSSVHFPNHFDAKKREVSMEGEILFDVAHRTNQPFVVSTDELVIDVLGTTFNVKSFARENTMETTLLKGKVRVADKKGRSLVLNPGQQAVYDVQTGNLSQRTVQAENVLAWKDGNLILDDESLRAVLLKIERIYDVTCVFDPGYRDVKIWGVLSTREKLQDMLPLLEKVSGVKLKLVDRKIFINQK